MARKTEKLTARGVEALKKRPGMHADGDGLYLQVKNGGASWVLRYQLDGKPRCMGLGPLSLFGLKEARLRANDARKLRHDGLDPLDERRAAQVKRKLDAAKAITFKVAATQYIASHRKGWRNAKHAAQWTSTLETYAYPIIGALPVQVVDTVLVLKIVEPLWASKAETAGRLRGRIESILDWARVREYRTGENPARWRGHLDKLLPARSKVARVRHHPALPYQDVPAFAADLRQREGISARALEFTLLTAARTTAVIGAGPNEFDLKAKVWTVPPGRAGVKIVGEDPKPRRVPLSRRAADIVSDLIRPDAKFVFPGQRSGSHLSDMAMLELMRDLRPGFVPHGLRSSFKDWCSEETKYPNEVSEAALWHTIADKTEAAYRRGELLEKRRRLMEDWTRYCERAPALKEAEIVVLRAHP